MAKENKARVRVFFGEIEGDNETIREGLQSIAAAVSKTFNSNPSIVKVLALKAEINDEELVERLTQIRGIGLWTVQMLMIFKLGRLDILPATDLGVQKGFSIVYKRRKLPTPKELLVFGDRWRPYRSIASWYLWRAVSP